MGHRLVYIDNVKGFALLVICISHIIEAAAYSTPYVFNNIVDILMYITVPLFFYISGMLYKPDRYKSNREYIKHKTKSLLIPYIALSLLFLLLCPYIYNVDYLVNELNYPRTNVFSSVLPKNASAIAEWILGDIISIVIGISSRSSMPLWLVYILFFVSITFHCLYKKKMLYGLILVSPLIAFYIPKNVITTYIHVQAFTMAFFFYSLGFFYGKQTISQRNKCIFAIVALITYVCVPFKGVNGFVNGLFGDALGRYMLHVMSGIYITIFVFEIIGKYSGKVFNIIFVPLQYISRNGLAIIGVHFWAMILYVVFISNHVCMEYQSLLIFIFIGVVVVISVPILNKYVYIVQKKILQ